ncbi:methyltransferase domain-containing protein [Erythrobacteraceae bacterium CFH 75059]|uniref:methyltransferase domain-containing protein n=1 Tax=Qipengyuania thermophila TaxID=2509361 RepID=UPI001021D9D7|nr:methyltransferase domain-containing protein [Qipengyuania thermophila]TCD05244.1 methyltransferase domain-containing protein [Erythrobacteraceae bacterium CFH 75059]
MLQDRAFADELMDDPDLPAETYEAVLADLARVNRATWAYRPTLQFLKRAVGRRRAFSVLDVGFGQGDMLRRIAAFARARGQAVRLVGVDLNRNSIAAARAATPLHTAIDFRHGDYADLAGEGWDCIISSLVAHHMNPAQLSAFLRFMDAEAQAGWFVNDLHRHNFAYRAYPWLARLLRVHPIVRHDGHVSIARAFRRSDWAAQLDTAGVAGARVRRIFPFRLCVEKVV